MPSPKMRRAHAYGFLQGNEKLAAPATFLESTIHVHAFSGAAALDLFLWLVF